MTIHDVLSPDSNPYAMRVSVHFLLRPASDFGLQLVLVSVCSVTIKSNC